ncbi:hypothetical protein OFN49_31555, partial [Escherichia coli]|nr:hypothetical protein [Escherichia coli]
MPFLRRRHVLLGALCAAGSTFRTSAQPAHATVVVPFAAGSAPDTVARLLVEPMAAELGMP